LAAHVAAVWALMQAREVRQAVVDVVPVFASLIAPPRPLEASVSLPQPKVIPASQVQYLEPIEIVYSRLSIRQREKGIVFVRLLIDEAGLPRDVQVSRSSGFARLDEAAVAAVRKARFKPPIENGRPVTGITDIPVDFQLENDNADGSTLTGERVGGGLNARSSQTPNRNPVGIVAPSYATGDLLAEFTLNGSIAFKLNVNNVTNKLFADSLYTAHYVPGAGRTALLSMTTRF